MIIHVVKQGETINSIAESYKISAERLIQENEIKNPNKLAVGEALVILYPEITYVILEGDTLAGIADAHGVTMMQLLRNNPYLSDREFIYPGETIVISYMDKKTAKLTVNGYAYPFINRNILRKTLPYLTYLTIFTHMFTADGNLIDVDDTEIIQMAKEYGVAPIMLITPFTDKDTDGIGVTHKILIDEGRQDRLIRNITTNLKTKGYYGFSINTAYIFPNDRQLYVEFVAKITTHLHNAGYKVFDTFSLNTFELITGIIYQGIDYAKLGQIIDDAMLLTYEWGYTTGVPSGTTPYETLKNLLSYSISQIPSEKINIGISKIGYIWELPYREGISKGQSVDYEHAIELAKEVGATILYDEVTKVAYFQYISTVEYVIRFRDARSVDAFVKLVGEYGLKGIGIWNIMKFFPQMWLIINSQYEIEKII